MNTYNQTFLNVSTELVHVIRTMPVTCAGFPPAERIKSMSTNPWLAGCHEPIQPAHVTVVQ